jgi:ribosomal protein S18 acetylase RimI-like enzyme
MIKIRTFEKADLSKIDYLQPDGWEDIKLYFDFFERSHFCFPVVAEIEYNIVGIANSLLNKGSGWISHIIVSDKFRNQGLGYQLTKHVMNILSENNCTTQLLIATKMGEILYEKLGFKKSARYNFYHGKKLDYPINENIRLLNSCDNGEVLKLDFSISGELRENMILQFISDGYVYEEKNSGKIIGYFLPELGDGVVLASNKKAGIELLKLKHTLKKCMTVIPKDNIEGNDLFINNGFELLNHAFRMVYGNEVNWKPQSVFCRIGGFYA